MLIDRWHEIAPKSHRAAPAASEFMGTYRRMVQRFEFSDEATAMAAKLAADYPDLLMRNYQFAVPPYRTSYIQYNSRVWAQAFGNAQYGHNDAQTDFNIGHLFHDNIAATIIDDDDDAHLGKGRQFVGVCPWLYTLSADASVLHLCKRHGLRLLKLDTRGSYYLNHETALAAVLLGTTLHHPRVRITDEIMEDISQRVRLWVDRSIVETGLNKSTLEMLKCFVGELRTMWQLLLFIQQPSHVHFDDVAASRRMIGNKPTAFPAYRLVRIKPHTTVHHITKSMRDRMKPGLHEVRPFWRNFDKNENCIHEWPLLPNEWGQFHCQQCSQWRVRVKEHERGDPSRPVPRKGYRV